MNIKSKIKSIEKLLFKNKLTKPTVMGNKILLLATAPCVKEYFENKCVREQFEKYDLACINYMLVYSTKEIFQWKPKYFILLDSIFYNGDVDPNSKNYNSEKKKVAEILEKVDWECYVVTSVMADFGIRNSLIKYVYLSCFTIKYNSWLFPAYKRNHVNLGIYNVIQGAIYFAITFGYKNIAILGCTYKYLQMEMKKDGLHIYNHNHYYNLQRLEETISYDEIMSTQDGFIATMYKRAVNSYKCCWDLQQYANKMNSTITNYSEGSMIDAFKMGDLNRN